MGLTNFPQGISSGGVPVLGGGSGAINAYRKVYFVSKHEEGSDGNSGLDIERPFATIQKALNTVTDEDTIIVLRGDYNEQLTTGFTPGAFSTTGQAAAGRGRYCNLVGVTQGLLPFDSPQLWNQAGSTATLNIRAQGWRLSGFRIVGDSGSPVCVRINQDGSTPTAGIEWASGTQVDNCVIYGAVGSTGGIQHVEAGNCRFFNNQFELFSSATLAALGDPTGEAASIPGRCIIQGNWFIDNVVNIDGAYNNSVIQHNIIGMNKENTMTWGIDLSPGNNNFVTLNSLDGTYTSGGVYKGGTGDDWIGNRVDDTGTNINDNTRMSIGAPNG